MEILNMLKGLIVSILLAISGGTQVPTAQIEAVATSTTEIVQEVVGNVEIPTKQDVKQAYDLGKAVGELEAKVTEIKKQTPPQMTQTESTPVPQAEQPSTPTPASPAPAQPTPAVETPPAPQAVASKARIEIINPIAGKGTNRPISTSTEFDERGNPKNEIHIGAIVYGDDGAALNNAEVRVSMIGPKEADSKTINGTGNMTTVYENGNKTMAPYYPFNYEFKDAGVHTITFSANGISTSVTVEVGE